MHYTKPQNWAACRVQSWARVRAGGLPCNDGQQSQTPNCSKQPGLPVQCGKLSVQLLQTHTKGATQMHPESIAHARTRCHKPLRRPESSCQLQHTLQRRQHCRLCPFCINLRLTLQSQRHRWQCKSHGLICKRKCCGCCCCWCWRTLQLQFGGEQRGP
jgi:hypothetical protein